MKVESPGEIIAERKFTLLRNNKQETVTVLLGKPQNTPNHSDFYCLYPIKGSDFDKIMAIGGVDAFRAIPLALPIIGVEREVLRGDTGRPLIWDADDKGDLGFAVPDSKKE